MKITRGGQVLASLSVLGTLAVGGAASFGAGVNIVGEMTTENVYETLNSDKIAGAPTEDMGFRARRGASAWWVIGWDETNDRTIIGTSTDGTVANTTGGAVVVGSLVFGTTVGLYEDAANVLAQRNGAAAQAFRVYNTYTDASNYERGFMGFVSNVWWVGAQAAGTGTARSMTLLGSGITFRNLAGGGDAWAMVSTGHFLASVTNTYDIGATAGANCPRNIYVGTSFLAPAGGLSAPAYSFSADTDTGLYNQAPGRIGVSSNGVLSVLFVDGVETRLVNSMVLGWCSGSPASVVSDAGLARLAAASLRQGLAPSATPVAQTFTIGEASRPGTDTDVGGANGTFRSGLGTGTGTASSLIFQTPSLAGSGSGVQSYATRLTITSGSFTVVGNILGDGDIRAGSGGYFYFNARSSIGSPSDGVIALYNGALTDFSRLCFGGTTSAFPALRRDSTSITCVLADNSNYADMIASTVNAINSAYYCNGVKVIGARGAAVADATGGVVIDAECRAAVNALLARFRVSTGHGSIAD